MLPAVKGALRTIEFGLALLGISLLLYAGVTLVRGAIYQMIERKRLSNLKPSQDSAKPTACAAEERSLQPNGSVIGRIDVPRIDLSTVMVEGDGDSELKLAAGHIPGTAFPGESGNIAIAGHRDTVFRALRSIHTNDSLVVTTRCGQFTYRVTSTQVVQPTDIGVLAATKSETLTLVTCYPFYFVGPAPRRFIVRAKRVPCPPKETGGLEPLGSSPLNAAMGRINQT